MTSTTLTTIRDAVLLTATLLALFCGVAGAASTEQVARSQQLQKQTRAQPAQFVSPAPLFIIQLRDAPVASYDGNIAGLPRTRSTAGQRLDTRSIESFRYRQHLISRHNKVREEAAIRNSVYEYVHTFNGFAARLNARQLAVVRNHPDVAKVWPNTGYTLDTSTTPAQTGLNSSDGPWRTGYTGEDVVIGIIDSGIWPEHPSFADAPSHQLGDIGELTGYGPPPPGWTGTSCDFGNNEFNHLDLPFQCNNKLIGAQSFSAGYLLESNFFEREFSSARDASGHGSHVASTAAGNNSVNVASPGRNKLVSGMAPRARIAAYKVCWSGAVSSENRCTRADIAAAIEQAVADGVDVLNLSLGGPDQDMFMPVAQALLAATDAGVSVIASAGNTGSGYGSVRIPGALPWVTSVGSTQYKQTSLPHRVVVITPNPNIAGAYGAVEANFGPQVTADSNVSGQMVLVDDGNGTFSRRGCKPLVNGAKLRGAIAFIARGGCSYRVKTLRAQAAGALGAVIYNMAGAPIAMGGNSRGITIPTVMVGANHGRRLAAAIKRGDMLSASLTYNVRTHGKPVIAGTSSRGPNPFAPGVLKPDVSAPGVRVLAASSPWRAVSDYEREMFEVKSGTSMASPHLAGITALLKQAHPEWSPAQIRSAISTSASPRVVTSIGAADAFATGAGFTNPQHALAPGLVHDISPNEYRRFLCFEPFQTRFIPEGYCDDTELLETIQLNLASITLPAFAGTATVSRTARATGGDASKTSRYVARTESAPGVDISVEPNEFFAFPGDEFEYRVTVSANDEVRLNRWAFGSVLWEQQQTENFPTTTTARVPVAALPVNFVAPDTINLKDQATSGSITINISSALSGALYHSVWGLVAPQELPGSVAEGEFVDHEIQVVQYPRLQRFALFDTDVGDGSGTSDLDLRVYEVLDGALVFADGSGEITSNELVDMEFGDIGTYVARVDHYLTPVTPTPYTLFHWNVTENNANLALAYSSNTQAGERIPVRLSWTDLQPDTRYLGVIEFAMDDALPVKIVVQLKTKP